MSEMQWRPLGLDTEEDIAEYDALHDGVPPWLSASVWAWVREAVTLHRSYSDGSGRIQMLDTSLAEEMCQILRIPLPDLRARAVSAETGKSQLKRAMEAFRGHSDPLQIVDYLLAHGGRSNPEELDALLERGKSAWTVGSRSGKPGLLRRVPLGVQLAADSVMAQAGRAGVRLAKAWEALYGVEPDASEASWRSRTRPYRLCRLGTPTQRWAWCSSRWRTRMTGSCRWSGSIHERRLMRWWSA